jgi:hypothetical protein
MTRTAISCRSPPASDCWKAVSWPRHLHLDRPGTGLGIGFGWPATGALPRVAGAPMMPGRSLGRMIDADPPRAARSAGPHRRPFAGRPRGADGAGDRAARRHQPHDPDVGGGVSRRGGARAVPAGRGAVPRAQRDQRRKRGLRPHVPPGRGARKPLDRPLSAGLGHHERLHRPRHRPRRHARGAGRPRPPPPRAGRRASATGRATCARAFSPSTAACSTCASRRSPPRCTARSPLSRTKTGEHLSAFPRIKPALAIASWAGPFTGVGDRPAGIRTLGTPPSGF